MAFSSRARCLMPKLWGECPRGLIRPRSIYRPAVGATRRLVHVEIARSSLKPPSFCRNGTFRAPSVSNVPARFLPGRCACSFASRGGILREAIGVQPLNVAHPAAVRPLTASTLQSVTRPYGKCKFMVRTLALQQAIDDSPAANPHRRGVFLLAHDGLASDGGGFQAALFCRRSRLARTRITLSAKNGVCLTMKRNCCS